MLRLSPNPCIEGTSSKSRTPSYCQLKPTEGQVNNTETVKAIYEVLDREVLMGPGFAILAICH